jgi:hypothetical protein
VPPRAVAIACSTVTSPLTLCHEAWPAPPSAQGKGPAAAAVRDICIKMRKERPPPAPGAAGAGAGGPGRIGRLFLIDREVDLVTPMMTQITFEGLIDEVTGIRHGSVPLAGAPGCERPPPSVVTAPWAGQGGLSATRLARALVCTCKHPNTRDLRWLWGCVRQGGSRDTN